MKVPFGEFLPDQDVQLGPGTALAKNVYSAVNTYLPFEDFQPVNPALNGVSLGGILARDKNGVVYTYTGTASTLYDIDQTNTNVSKTGGYGTADGERWRFIKWGENVIATNFNDPVQIIGLGNAQFADLAGSPPRARHIAVIRDFVFLGNVNDTIDGIVPNRVHWSAFNDETDWDPVNNTQSDIQDLRGNGGFVQAIVGGEFGIVFQERSIWRVTFTGGDTVFRFDDIEPNRGTPAPGSVVRYGRDIYYLGIDGFYVLRDGSKSFNIGAEKIDRWFYDNADVKEFDKITSVVDPSRNLVIWSYQTVNSDNNLPDRLLIYNWVTEKWSYADLCMSAMFQSATFGFDLEGMDVFGTLEEIPLSLDSRAYAGGADTLLGGINHESRFGYFNGAPLTAELDTKELGGELRLYVDAMRPYIEGDSQTNIILQLGSRNKLTDPIEWSPDLSLTSTDRAYIRKNARYHKARAIISGGFNHAKSVDIMMKPAGKR